MTTVKIDESQFPPNSEKKPETEEKQQPISKKLVSGEVIKKKQGILSKFTEAFLGDDAETVADYIVWDVLVPAAKNTIFDMFSGGIDMLLWGGRRGSSHRSSRRDDRDSRTRVSYSGYYDRGRSSRRDERDDRDDRRSTRGGRTRFDDIIIRNRDDAERVLDAMVDRIEEYDEVTVSDFYAALDLPSEFVDTKYGWTDLSRATVRRVREGYIIDMPREKELD